MDALISLFLKAAHTRAGMLIQWAAGAFMGWLVSWLATVGLDLPPGLVEQIQSTLIATGIFLVSHFIQVWQNRHNAWLQKALGMPPEKQDGLIGNKTIARAQDIVQAILEGEKIP